MANLTNWQIAVLSFALGTASQRLMKNCGYSLKEIEEIIDRLTEMKEENDKTL
jgi:uncharacterized Fe-S cluster-containing MiaB family protein